MRKTGRENRGAGSWLMAVALVVATATSGLAVEEGRFTLEDLEGMIRKGGWSEAMQRLEDVPAAERPKSWDSIVEKVVVGYLKETASQDPNAGEVMARELSKKYPLLMRSRAFRGFRNQNALQGFERCLKVPQDRDECVSRLADFAKEQPDDFQLALQAGRLVGEKHRADLAFPFFQRAVTVKAREVCSDPIAQRAIMAALAYPEGQTRTGVMKVAAGACWSNMRSKLEAELDRSPSGDLRGNLCTLLKAKGQLKGNRRKLCE